MTQTIVESKTKTAVIGFDQPFCVIGERINPPAAKSWQLNSKRATFRPLRRMPLLRFWRVRPFSISTRAWSTTRTPTRTRPSRR